MNTKADRWAATGPAVRHRREELGLTQRQAADLGGISEPTWGLIENQPGPRSRRTLLGVCRALGWTADSFDRMLKGQPPQISHRPVRGRAGREDSQHLVEVDAALQALTRQVEALRRRLDEIGRPAPGQDRPAGRQPRRDQQNHA